MVRGMRFARKPKVHGLTNKQKRQLEKLDRAYDNEYAKAPSTPRSQLRGMEKMDRILAKRDKILRGGSRRRAIRAAKLAAMLGLGLAGAYAYQRRQPIEQPMDERQLTVKAMKAYNDFIDFVVKEEPGVRGRGDMIEEKYKDDKLLYLALRKTQKSRDAIKGTSPAFQKGVNAYIKNDVWKELWDMSRTDSQMDMFRFIARP